MTLSTAFQTAKNLGALTEVWLRYVRSALKAKPVDIGVKLQVDNAASVVAPGALVATIVQESGLQDSKAKLRVLLLGSDPLIRFDKSRWATLAGEFLGRPGSIEIVLTADEDARSDFSKLAATLELPACSVLSHEHAVQGNERLDLVIWLHPATETSDEAETLNMVTALAMAGAQGVPTYTASFNEVDLNVQNYLIHESGWQLDPLGGMIGRGARSVNRFGISTSDLGVEGGWAAILGKLAPAERRYTPAEIALVRTAMKLVCSEGALHSSWTLGQRVNGVAFNRIIPVGLLGNMAVDPVTGHVFQQDEDTRELRLVGHLWTSMAKSMPTQKDELLRWACSLKLAFLNELPKEDARRSEAIVTLENGFSEGVVEAGVALARCYENSKANGSQLKAIQWHQKVGIKHPISAYSLAYECIAADDLLGAEAKLRDAVTSGYPVAMTDLGKLLCTSGRYDEGLQWLNQAAALSEAEANYELGELSAKNTRLEEALAYLRNAWTYGHVDAVALAAQVAEYMLKQGIGKRSFVKREAKEIESFQKKLQRRQVKDVG